MPTHRGLKGKVAVVTGGRQGIGRGICLYLASLGCDVAIVDLYEASELSSQLQHLGVRSQSYVSDVSQSESVFPTVEKIIEDFHTIDILVNNAGVCFFEPFLETSEGNWDRTIEVNLKGVFLFSQAVARHMKERLYGKIITTISNAAILGYVDISSYTASKAGAAALTTVMAAELGPYNINVNAVSPGSVKAGELSKEYLKEGREAFETAVTPLRRLGTPEDIAQLVGFLASDDSGWITGQTITIDGGFSIVPA